jgi:hypothetical protein
MPLILNFESSAPVYLNASTTGVPGEDRLDFVASNQARLFSAVNNAPASFGARSLVLDKEKVDTRTGTGEAIFTFNFSGYPNPREMKLSFDLLSFGSLTTGNFISMRPSDQAAWTTVRNLSQEGLIAGVTRSFSNIDLIPFLAGASPTSSFQLRFSFSGQRNSEIETLGGYAVDNISISLPSSDAAVSGMVLPGEDCYTENASRPVKVDVRNTGLEVLANVPVSYQVAGFLPVTDTLKNLGAGETRTHTFSRGLSSSQFGSLQVKSWVNSPGDGNQANDTVPLQVVSHFKIINRFPHYESFENHCGSWAASATGAENRWVWGSGLGKLSAIDSAANGLKFWFSNPSVNQASETSYLLSPCFDFSQLSDLQLSFNMSAKLSGIQNQVWMEVSTNGTDWTRLGSSGNGTNWYNLGDNAWASLRNHWQPAGVSLPGQLAGANRVRFRMVLNQPLAESGEGFAMDDFHLEPIAGIEMTNGLDQSEASSDPSSWLVFGTDGNRAAMVQNSTGLGMLNCQLQLNPNSGRSYMDKHYLDRNFLFLAQSTPAQPQLIRLFLADQEIKNLMEKDPELPGIQKLGVFRYNGSNRDFSIDNNDFSEGSDFSFLSDASVLKVPTAGGCYLQFEANCMSEFYISRISLVDFSPAQGLRMASMEKPPHQPVEVKWLTPLDESVGKELSKKLAWLDPSAEMLYLDGLNGNQSRIRLLDLKGQVMLDEVFTGYKFESKTSMLPKGIYTLRVEQESGAETFRLVMD